MLHLMQVPALEGLYTYDHAAVQFSYFQTDYITAAGIFYRTLLAMWNSYSATKGLITSRTGQDTPGQ